MAESQQPKSTSKRKSRYVQGGTTTRYPNRLGWWERRSVPQRDDDLFKTVTSQEATRADIIAFNVYGDASLAWLVMQYNNIVDNVTELAEGREIRLPSKQRVSLSILTNPTGGVPVR